MKDSVSVQEPSVQSGLLLVWLSVIADMFVISVVVVH